MTKILICHYNDPRAKEVTENFRKEGHQVLATDWQPTQEKVPNFFRVNYLNFGDIATLVRRENPDEIHNFVGKAYLANNNILWAGTKVRKMVFYYEEPSELLDTIAQAIAKEYGFKYEKK